MRLFRAILGWLFAPRQLAALAALSAAGGLLWLYATLQDNADRALALRQGPPAVVAVEAYRGPADRGPAGEVVLRARAEPDAALLLTLPGSGARALVVPLFAVSGGTVAQGAIFLPLDAGEAPPDLRAVVAADADGTVTVNGHIVQSGDFALLLAGALAVEGRLLGDRFIAVRPYLHGREAALQPATTPPRGWLWPLVLATVLALAAGCRRFGGSSRAEARGPAPAARPAAAPAAASTRFPPLRRAEEIPVPHAGARAAPVLTFAGAATRGLLQMTSGALRLLRAGVAEIRSPR